MADTVSIICDSAWTLWVSTWLTVTVSQWLPHPPPPSFFSHRISCIYFFSFSVFFVIIIIFFITCNFFYIFFNNEIRIYIIFQMKKAGELAERGGDGTPPPPIPSLQQAQTVSLNICLSLVSSWYHGLGAPFQRK